jgi:hypothetical protein
VDAIENPFERASMTERIDPQRQGRGGLVATWVLDAIARKWPAPIRWHASDGLCRSATTPAPRARNPALI